MLNKYIVVKPIHGLKKGETLILNQKKDMYEFSQEEATDSTTSVRRISISTKLIDSLLGEGFIKAMEESEEAEYPCSKFTKMELYKMMREREIKAEIMVSKIDDIYKDLGQLIDKYEADIEDANDNYHLGKIANYEKMEAITVLQNLIHLSQKVRSSLAGI